MKIREHICCWLFETTKIPYSTYIKKNEAWNISRSELKEYPIGTLAHTLGVFLVDNDYQFIPKLESHDVYHVITGYSTTVKDEIALQYFFLGNGKTSIYLYAVIFLGAALFPEYYPYFNNSFKNGKTAIPFFKWDLKLLLPLPLEEIRTAIYETKDMLTPIYKVN